MPLHAISAAVVDFVLPADEIPVQLSLINRSTRTGSSSHRGTELNDNHDPPKLEIESATSGGNHDAEVTDFQLSAENIMLEKSPANVIVNEELDIVHIHGDITPFLNFSPGDGEPGANLVKISPEHISAELQNIVNKVKFDPSCHSAKTIFSEAENHAKVSVEVTRIPKTGNPYYLIFFSRSDQRPTVSLKKERENEMQGYTASPNRERVNEPADVEAGMEEINKEYGSDQKRLLKMNKLLRGSREKLDNLYGQLKVSGQNLESVTKEIKISRQELLEKQERLDAAYNYMQSLISTVRQPLLILDGELRIKSHNESYAKKFRHGDEELEGKYFFDVHKQLWKNRQLLQWLGDVLSGNKDSGDFDISLDIRGAPHSLILSAREITEWRKKNVQVLLLIDDVTGSVLNQRLQQCESSFRHLALQTKDLIWTADGKGSVNYVNVAMAEFTGMGTEEFYGDGWLNAVSAPERAFISERWKEALRTGEPLLRETRLRKPNGLYVPHVLRVVPHRDTEGEILMWLGTFSEIEGQESFSEKLEKKVRERTAELERKNELLNGFAHTVSHDLQEPLRKIMMFSGLIRNTGRELLPDDVKKYLDKIEDASSRMSNLIRDLLNFSKVSDAKNSKSNGLFEETDLNRVLENVLNDFELLIEEKNAEIIYQKLPSLQAVPFQINQLFYNLVGNALKFSREDTSPVLTVDSRRLSVEELTKFDSLNLKLNYFEISFKDNGIGFNPQYADQIFHVFLRLNHPAQYKGTGIGLALSKKIVEMHQGDIYAASTEGSGAEFFVILPEKQA